MLSHVHLHNVGLFESLDLSLANGLTAITGETGAGKSLFINSILAVFSKKQSAKALLRAQANKGRIELSFDLTHHQSKEVLLELLTLHGIERDPEHPNELIISRELSESTSRSRIQGSLVPMDVIEALSPYLLEIHGQHDLHKLFSPGVHRDILDTQGHEDDARLLQNVKASYKQWQEAQQTLKSLEDNEQERLRTIDFLQFQINEISQANITDPSEDEQLEQQRKRLSSFQALKTTLLAVSNTLTGDSRQDTGSLRKLAQQASGQLAKVLAFDEDSLSPLHNALCSIEALIDDANTLARQYQDQLATEPVNLDETVERLDELAKLKRKYGPTLADVQQQLLNATETLTQLEAHMANYEKLQADVIAFEVHYRELAGTLSQKRHTLAAQLTKAVEGHLKALELPNAKFSVAVDAAPQAGLYGLDTVQFLFCANPGAPMLPLQSVASGGELARVMLAIKLVSYSPNRECLILDEIDTGLSGIALKSLAENLKKASEAAQIILITHQPLLAGKAKQHLHIQKQQSKHTTVSTIRALAKQEERAQILAQMASGETTVTETVTQFAQSLLSTAP